MQYKAKNLSTKINLRARHLIEKSQPREKRDHFAQWLRNENRSYGPVLGASKYPDAGTDFAPFKVFITGVSFDTL